MTFFDRDKVFLFKNFSAYAAIYEHILGSSEQQGTFFKNIAERHCINTVLDVFCLSGNLAVLLAGLGKTVTAFVPELPLKEDLALKCAQAAVKLEICCGDMRDLSNLYRKRCDLIVCLQNSLALLLNEKDIWGTLAQMYLKLEPGGVLVMHTLNYDRFLNLDSCFLPAPAWPNQGMKAELLFRQGKGGGNAHLIFKFFPDDVTGGPGKEFVFPVRPILTKELNLWLAELGFEKILSYDWYDWKTYSCSGFHRITVASRPGAAAV